MTESNIPLAGLGIDRLLVTDIARTLWCDVWWTDEREAEYRQQAGCQWQQQLLSRTETPDIPDLDDALFKLFHAVGRIEQAWGRSFYAVARDMYPEVYTVTLVNGEPFQEKLEMLVYRTLMACIGHGIGPDDDGDFPEDLDASPIDIENPLQEQVL